MRCKGDYFYVPDNKVLVICIYILLLYLYILQYHANIHCMRMMFL